ncbi:MAG: hypothetical protein SX243_15515 [Acidobacteriota bacterium]|nr:hypothetical protein [Acidobacteriota bacterium]
MSFAGAVPYVIGQWVRGDRFYGRRAELAELAASGGWHWLAGLRRVGKTSLLKQLDFLHTGSSRRLPVFWDLQGVDGAEELAFTFGDALLDAEEALESLGIDPGEIEDDDLFAALSKLARALEASEAELLLLCDEVDELAALADSHPDLLAGLHRALDAFPRLQVVLASSVRLCDQPFPEPPPDLLRRCGAPRYLGVLTNAEALSLVRQDQLPEAARPALDAAAEQALLTAAGNHPMLLQILAKRCAELGSVEAALEQVAADRAVDHFFSVDFDLLAPAERQLLLELAARGSAPVSEAQRLLELGLVRREGDGLVLGGTLLGGWLRLTGAKPPPTR